MVACTGKMRDQRDDIWNTHHWLMRCRSKEEKKGCKHLEDESHFIGTTSELVYQYVDRVVHLTVARTQTRDLLPRIPGEPPSD